jgi:hypothetical protein
MRKLTLSEDAIVGWIARVAPWLAPVPTAYLVYEATGEYLGWPVLVRLAAAIVIESLGLSSVSTALTFREHNRGLRDEDDRTAPFWLVTVLAGIYLSSVTVLTVVLEVKPTLATWAPLLFPLFSLCGAVLIAVRADHQKRMRTMILSLAAPYNTKRWRIERKRLLKAMEDGDAKPEAEGDNVDEAVDEGQSDGVGRRPQADREDWRAIYRSTSEDLGDLHADDVTTMLKGADFASPSRRTLYAWAKEARRWSNGRSDGE